MMQYADQLTVTANHAGTPGISFPAGFDHEGMPIGVQLLGPDFSEGMLLQLTHAYEQVTADAEWRRRRPALLEEV
jgi:aspartyl-tRNA(Asn)/glutamyl-tRNA(Gln) amidotransferase subunit A